MWNFVAVIDSPHETRFRNVKGTTPSQALDKMMDEHPDREIRIYWSNEHFWSKKSPAAHFKLNEKTS